MLYCDCLPSPHPPEPFPAGSAPLTPRQDFSNPNHHCKGLDSLLVPLRSPGCLPEPGPYHGPQVTPDWPSGCLGFCLNFLVWHCCSFQPKAATCFPTSPTTFLLQGAEPHPLHKGLSGNGHEHVLCMLASQSTQGAAKPSLSSTLQ